MSCTLTDTPLQVGAVPGVFAGLSGSLLTVHHSGRSVQVLHAISHLPEPEQQPQLQSLQHTQSKQEPAAVLLVRQRIYCN